MVHIVNSWSHLAQKNQHIAAATKKKFAALILDC